MPIYSGPGFVKQVTRLVTIAEVYTLHSSPVLLVDAVPGVFFYPLTAFGVYTQPPGNFGIISTAIGITPEVPFVDDYHAALVYSSVSGPMFAGGLSGMIAFSVVEVGALSQPWFSDGVLPTQLWLTAKTEDPPDSDMGELNITLIYAAVPAY